MKHPILLPIFTALGILSLCSCVDPYYGGSYSYSGTATFSTLPYGYHTIYVGGTPYYYCDNRWYRRSGSHYVICPRPHGYHGSLGRHHHYNSISRLPYGCKTTYVGGHRYYTHGDKWYRKSGSGYVTCPKPSGHTHHQHRSSHPSYKHKDHGKKHSPDYHRRPGVKPVEHTGDQTRPTGSSPRNRSGFFHNRSKSTNSPGKEYAKNTTKSPMTASTRNPATASKSPAMGRQGPHVARGHQDRPEKGKNPTLTRLRSKFARERD